MPAETPAPIGQGFGRAKTYAGRSELDAAWARFRRAVARAAREGNRSPDVVKPLAAVVAEATETLLRLASDAEAAERNSTRNREALRKAEEGLARIRRRAARQGVTLPQYRRPDGPDAA